MTDWNAIAELNKRGLLSEDQRGAYDEAVKRGLAPNFSQDTPKKSSFVSSVKEVPSSLNESLVKRGTNIADTLTAEGDESIAQTILKTPSRTLDVVGDVAGFMGDVTGDVTEPIISPVLTKIAEFIPDNIKSKAVEALRVGGDKWDSFKKENPEWAKHIESATNIATTFPITKAAKTALTPAGKASGALADVLESNLKKKASKEALDITSRDIKFMKPAEKKAALATGQVKQSPVFKKTTVNPSYEDIEIAKSVEGVVHADKSAVDNITAIRSEIGKKADEVIELPGMDDRSVDVTNIINNLENAKTNNSIIFAGDKALEGNYNAVIDEYMNILSKHPQTLNGVLGARKEFDAIIKEKFPNIYSKFSGDNIRANAIKDIRMAANDFVAENLPNGNQFKDLLKTQSNMYKAIDRITAKTVSTLNNASTKDKIVNLAKKHPIIASQLLIGIGSGGTIAAGYGDEVLQMLPYIASGVVAYGGYKVGKATITSRQLRESMQSVLKYGEKTLTSTEKAGIKDLIGTLLVAENAIEGESSSKQTEVTIDGKKKILTEENGQLVIK